MFFRRIIAFSNARLIKNYTSKAAGASTVEQSPELIAENNSVSQGEYQSFSRNGDCGKTGMLTGDILSKDHRIFHAIGTTEELLSYIGLAREYALDSQHDYIYKLQRIQTVLIDITTAISRYGDKNAKKIPPSNTKELEDWIAHYSKELPPPERYIIPGGGVASASLHVARSICRRMERVVVPLVNDGGLDNESLIYLNRLSDFLFTLSRIATKLDRRTESIYVPQTDETLQAQ